MKMQKAVFTCTGVERFVGYYDPKDLWNGWYSPYFPEEEIPNILLAFGPSKPNRDGLYEDQTIFDRGDDCFYSATMVSMNGEWVIDYDNCDGWFSEGESEIMDTVDGPKKLYPLGGGWMTWHTANASVSHSPKSKKPSKTKRRCGR